jgi:hypothetical protein
VLCQHIRRWDTGPTLGRWCLTCDCGWTGTAVEGKQLASVEDQLNSQFIAHLAPDERQTYLLVDSRRPRGFREVEQIMEQEGVERAEAERLFRTQQQIVGTFVMPEGLPAMLLDWSEDSDMRRGRVRLDTGRVFHLPVGEVRTEDGRVFRCDE